MAKVSAATRKKRPRKDEPAEKKGLRIPIVTKLFLGFLLITVITSVVFTVMGIRLIANRLVTEAQETVRLDLNAGREIYNSHLNRVYDVVRLTAQRFFLSEALSAENINAAAEELVRVKIAEKLDLLTITDDRGIVLLRTNDLTAFGDDQSRNDLVAAVLERKVALASTTIVSAEELHKESPLLANQAYFEFVDTPLARPRPETEETAGMMLMTAAPIRDENGILIGVLYGGILLNRNYDIVDEIKRTVFQGLEYKGKDIGTATIFQDDVRISTNVKNEDGSRAIGTRISEEVYERVFIYGEPWISKAYVVNNWYITAYEPIENINHQRIGILYVGVSEQKYTDIERETIFVFLAVTLAGVLVSLLLSYYIARKVSVPIDKLVSASRELAGGNLDTKVAVISNDEVGELAGSFNSMAAKLKQRDDILKEFTRSKLMESERLALIGQLAANVAHELNNPLTGIITYSHLLLEQTKAEEPSRDFLQKIVNQANRCKEIIKALLDFSRQKKPDKTLCDINNVLRDCISLVENQAMFHNIQFQSSLKLDLPRAVIDPSQIERVFMNMIINAAEAMEESGSLTITTRFDEEHSRVEIEFTDTGSGIEKENLEKIFDPFFTTKDTGHGLGLAICYGIVKEHKGSISVESEVGKGTTFIIRLPVNMAEESSKNAKEVQDIDH
jgi:two-component system NtrC family sensor kinase